MQEINNDVRKARLIGEIAAVFLGALLVGVLYIGPTISIKKQFEKSGYSFVLAQYKTYRDSLQAYLPRAREIYDGHFPPAELYGPVNGATIQNSIPSVLFSLFIFLFSNINFAYLGAQFVFSGIIFIFLYVLGRFLFNSKTWSWFFALTGVLSPIILKLPFYKWKGLAEFQAFFINNFLPFVRTQFDQLYLARIDEPLLTYPLYLAAIFFFFKFWYKPSFLMSITSGIFAGLLFYSYFHHWVYWLSVLLLLFAYVVIWRDQHRFKPYLVLLLSLVLTVIPYFWQYFKFIALSTQQDFILRSGVAFGRTLGLVRENIADYLIYLLLAVIAYFIYRKNNHDKLILIWGLIGGMFLVWNVQLVTGYLPVPHFFRRSISPIIFIIIFTIIYDIYRSLSFKRIKFTKAFSVILVILSVFIVTKKILNIVYINKDLQPHIYDYYKFSGDVSDSWNWINKSLPHESVLVSDSTLTSFYLNTYTSARPFLPTAFITLLSVSEMEERYLISHKIFNVDEKVLEKRLLGNILPGCKAYNCPADKDSNLNDSFGNLYGNYFPSRYGTFRSFFSNYKKDYIVEKKKEKIKELSQLYKEKSETLVKKMQPQIDYVYFGPLEKQISEGPLKIDGIKIVYKNSLVSIYQIIY